MWGNIFECGVFQKEKTCPVPRLHLGWVVTHGKAKPAHGFRLYFTLHKKMVTLGYECPRVLNRGAAADDDKILMSF